jgi:hypothetical protein
MMDLCVASTKRAVTLFEIETALRYLAKKASVFCDRFCDLLATHFSLATPMKDEPWARGSFESG